MAKESSFEPRWNAPPMIGMDPVVIGAMWCCYAWVQAHCAVVEDDGGEAGVERFPSVGKLASVAAGRGRIVVKSTDEGE